MPDDCPCSISAWAFLSRFWTCSSVSVPLFSVIKSESRRWDSRKNTKMETSDSPCSEALLKFFHRWWTDKDEHSIKRTSLHRPCPLNINVKNASLHWNQTKTFQVCREKLILILQGKWRSLENAIDKVPTIIQHKNQILTSSQARPNQTILHLIWTRTSPLRIDIT